MPSPRPDLTTPPSPVHWRAAAPDTVQYTGECEESAEDVLSTPSTPLAGADPRRATGTVAPTMPSSSRVETSSGCGLFYDPDAHGAEACSCTSGAATTILAATSSAAPWLESGVPAPLSQSASTTAAASSACGCSETRSQTTPRRARRPISPTTVAHLRCIRRVL
jgi:hypothetical protein